MSGSGTQREADVGRIELDANDDGELEVVGHQKMRYELTPDAKGLGLDAALPAELELGALRGGFGRGERTRGFTYQVAVTIVDGHSASIVSRSSDVA